MSKTVPVCSGDAMFWAYDVALGILFFEAARVGAETPADTRPAWWPDLEEDLRTQLVVNTSVLLDHYDDEQRRLLLDCVTEAARRIEARGGVSRDEVAAWDEIEEDATRWLRGAEHITPAPLVELATAIVDLTHGTLPPAPPGRHWLFGTPAGRTIQGT
ncbi:hypothetical protein BZB76_6609 [Actinomadura pelletieri DSM 43383]|uniref:Uncharacterized protein n=1 Tax=Actinomadura pelletieri DSM 43383 TaxID=1120940 RepID=A0A495QAK4_9ACTN|nr:hypothetical protein [Actinomadura pelletieri]RKS68346.1 hypothetical protein BZB76_6609 [Actinomadura pelletieri DSM 43383]